MEKKNFKDRKFKFWFYQVSYSEAIIRSLQTVTKMRHYSTISGIVNPLNLKNYQIIDKTT